MHVCDGNISVEYKEILLKSESNTKIKIIHLVPINFE
jgi:hypothetical protein